jgi:hypothetical protein
MPVWHLPVICQATEYCHLELLLSRSNTIEILNNAISNRDDSDRSLSGSQTDPELRV